MLLKNEFSDLDFFFFFLLKLLLGFFIALKIGIVKELKIRLNIDFMV